MAVAFCTSQVVEIYKMLLLTLLGLAWKSWTILGNSIQRQTQPSVIMTSDTLYINPEEAVTRLSDLLKNLYPGRGLIIGMTPDQKHLVQISWIMGRSPNSRNRVYRSGMDGRVYTDWANPTVGGDPTLVIYNAMLQNQQAGKYVVSNGHQTDTVLQAMLNQGGGGGFMPGLANWQYEPDAPNFTPRITGALSLSRGLWRADFSVLSRRTEEEDCRSEHFFTSDIMPGYGSCLTTYTGDGNPLPSFTGAPYTLPLEYDRLEDMADQYWGRLNYDNKVALAVKFIDIKTGNAFVSIRNKA